MSKSKRPPAIKNVTSSNHKTTEIKDKNTLSDATVAAVKKGLAPPFPSSPTRPPTHVLYFTQNGKTRGIMNFSAVYAARRFLDRVLGDAKYKWSGDYSIVTDDMLEIKCEPELEEIIEHTLTKQEKEWEMPEPYPRIADYIREGKYAPLAKAVDQLPQEVTEATSRTKKPGKDKAPAPGKEPGKVKRAPPPGAELPKGHIGLGTICAELKIEPRDARNVLRKHETKPDTGWTWPAKEVDRIKKLLKKELSK